MVAGAGLGVDAASPAEALLGLGELGVERLEELAPADRGEEVFEGGVSLLVVATDRLYEPRTQNLGVARAR